MGQRENDGQKDITGDQEKTMMGNRKIHQGRTERERKKKEQQVSKKTMGQNGKNGIVVRERVDSRAPLTWKETEEKKND